MLYPIISGQVFIWRRGHTLQCKSREARRVDKLHRNPFDDPTLPHPTLLFYVVPQATSFTKK